MKTYHIHITGQVQGVGFRPYIFRIAQKFGLHGEVCNASSGISITFNAIDSKAKKFYQALLSAAPALAHITGSTLCESANQNFGEFKIVTSEYEGQRKVLLTPDFGICQDCRMELTHEGTSNRRTGYPFITCTNCGPRYSIIHHLPYDRENTSMKRFNMCRICENEYHNPADRRFYSQTNSCPECGISLHLNLADHELPSTDYKSIIQKTIQLLAQGKIIAVKGIGGYLLICDASNKECIDQLRERKARPTKPFALMYPNIEMVKDDAVISPEEETILTHPASPIVLLQVKENVASGICISSIAPGLSQVGVMLPYAPVYELLLSAYLRPIVATSANASGSPIIYDDGEAAFEQLNTIADCIIGNNRQIVVPQDDSVIKYSTFGSHKIVIRRSRGLAPTYINPDLKVPSETILATGALLKSTFTLTHQQNIYISQYLGDLDDYDAQKNYQHCLNHFYCLLDTRPAIILSDNHPDYYSSRYAADL
jgi:hydrogenase maturation protein HypF